jgi:hypothetical protein
LVVNPLQSGRHPLHHQSRKTVLKMQTMNTLPEAKKYVDSFSRPEGFNNYAWEVTKKLALEAWESYLDKRPFRRQINYMCKEFYAMIRRPEDGEYILPRNSFRMLGNV